jgi:DNA-binding transcriptional regulator LsrR (DeoR family)
MMGERAEMLKEWVEHHMTSQRADPAKEKELADVLASLSSVSDEVRLIATLAYVFGISLSAIATKIGISRTAVAAKIRPVSEILSPAKPRGIIREEILKAFPALPADELTFAVKRVHNLKNHRYDPERSLSQDEAIQQVKAEVAAAIAAKHPYLGAPGVGVTASGRGVEYTVNGITGTPAELLRKVTGLLPSSAEYKRLYRQIYNEAQKKSMEDAVRDVVGRFSSAG